MKYNVGERIIYEPSYTDYNGNVALIKMNTTFPDVNVFPEIFDLYPVPEEVELSCTTVGFSLIGRELLKEPNYKPDAVMPIEISVNVKLDLVKCFVK